MWSDNETAIDLLNVQHLVEAVLRVIRDDRLSPVTVGVFGDWGSGKSSVIQMVKAKLDADPDVICVYFNGWRFEGYEDAKAALATTILEEIKREAESDEGKLVKIREKAVGLVEKMWSRVDHLRLGRLMLGAGVNAGIATTGAVAAGVALSPAALLTVAITSILAAGKSIDGDTIAKLLKEENKRAAETQRDSHQMIRDFHRDFANLITELDLKRLVVIVDDLDRCLPPNVIDTLEAIRLFLSAPKTAFVVAADEAVIRNAVAQRFPGNAQKSAQLSASAEFDVGARYLEKLIQVPVRVPPLSRGDLHGYLNLLFAEQHENDSKAFAALCKRVRDASSFDVVSFRADNAEAMLQAPLSEGLKRDLALAEQIAPVLAVCAEGNPRQTKRFLNALVLRGDMAAARGVKMDRAVAAKMLLLEYFLPEIFRGLALSIVQQEGRAPELPVLEERVRPPAQKKTSRAKDAPLSGTTEKRSKGQSQEGENAEEMLTLPAYAAGALSTDRFRTWLLADPPLAGLDLRPYVYFAAERYALPLGVTQRLSPTGQDVLQRLLQPGESVHIAAAKRIPQLPLSDVSAIIAELSGTSRRGEDLGEKDSPLAALFKVAEARSDAVGEVLAAVSMIPAIKLPSSAAVTVGKLGKKQADRETVESLLQSWIAQDSNPSLATASASRLDQLRSNSPK